MKKVILPDGKITRKKKFDEHLLTKYDLPAREKIKKILGEGIIDNPDKYGEDMIICNENCSYKYLELQVYSNWIETFPFKYPFVYARKIKYDDQTLFLAMNYNMTKGLIFDKKSFDKQKPRRYKKYSREFVYDVPWHRVMQVYINKLDWQTLKLY